VVPLARQELALDLGQQLGLEDGLGHVPERVEQPAVFDVTLQLIGKACLPVPRLPLGARLASASLSAAPRSKSRRARASASV